MLFKLKITDEYIKTSKHEYMLECAPTIISTLYSMETFNLFYDLKYISYEHKVCSDEFEWMSNLASMYRRLANPKRLDSSELGAFFCELSDFFHLVEAGANFVAKGNGTTRYEPKLKNSSYFKKLCGIKLDDGYYFCEPYNFIDKNNVDYDKYIFNDAQLEPSFKKLVDLLEIEHLAKKIPLTAGEQKELLQDHILKCF